MDELPSLRFRFEKAGASTLLLWFALDGRDEMGPIALTEADATDLVTIFERAAAIIRAADARAQPAATTGHDGSESRRIRLVTEPFALRAVGNDEGEDEEDDR